MDAQGRGPRGPSGWPRGCVLRGEGLCWASVPGIAGTPRREGRAPRAAVSGGGPAQSPRKLCTPERPMVPKSKGLHPRLAWSPCGCAPVRLVPRSLAQRGRPRARANPQAAWGRGAPGKTGHDCPWTPLSSVSLSTRAPRGPHYPRGGSGHPSRAPTPEAARWGRTRWFLFDGAGGHRTEALLVKRAQGRPSCSP